jgi:hypothetical protein
VTSQTTVTLGRITAQGVGSAEDTPETIEVLPLEFVEQRRSFIGLTHPSDDCSNLKVRITFLCDLDDIAVSFEGLDK